MFAARKGLSERFDSTIGRGTVLMPFGGKRQLTPSEGMVGRLPVLHGEKPRRHPLWRAATTRRLPAGARSTAHCMRLWNP